MADGSLLTIEPMEQGVFHFQLLTGRTEEYSQPLLTKYQILRTDWPEYPAFVSEPSEGAVRIEAGGCSLEIYPNTAEIAAAGAAHPLKLCYSGRLGAPYRDKGFRLDISLDDDERLYGLGDETRERLMKRGHKAILWQTNVSCYGPIPFLMSTNGWGILMNCTFAHSYDLGASDPSRLRIGSDKGILDFYLFLAKDMPGILQRYTDVSGKPVLLPKSAYGLTFVCNEEDGARELMEDCRHFRTLNIPCDIMGLEPGWMETHYDYSVNKRWDPVRFYIPSWYPINSGGPWTFFAGLRRMGFRLSLWLCCDYDLFWEEEHTALNLSTHTFGDAEIEDEHFSQAVLSDKITQPGQPWFEHLKKFVDQGAACFKLDGSNQIIEHPDRLWAGKYLDEEIHNLYPVVYGKQMQQGYTHYTGKRAMIYTPGLYTGIQQYCASWAGDTGGGPKTLVSILNLGMCGHANASCDLDADSVEGIHYGFLLPWAQQLAWRNWMHPWFLGEELEEVYRQYAQLRSSLFYYLYATAHQAAQTGMPIARPLSLIYPSHPEYDQLLHQYFLGDSLLVGAFQPQLTLPEGIWTDFWTSERYTGGQTIDYHPPKNRGGALFVKAGAILPLQKWMPYLTHHVPEALFLHLYPGADGSFVLYEDDGESYAYQDGAYATTSIRMEENSQEGFCLAVDRRHGSYEGMGEVFTFQAVVHTDKKIRSIVSDERPIPFQLNEDGTYSFTIPSEKHGQADLRYRISYL